MIQLKAGIYAKCIELNDIQNVKKDICFEEFKKLKQCFKNALKNIK